MTASGSAVPWWMLTESTPSVSRPAASAVPSPIARGKTAAARQRVASAATAAAAQLRSATATPATSSAAIAAYGVKAISATNGKPLSRPSTRTRVQSTTGTTGTQISQ